MATYRNPHIDKSLQKCPYDPNHLVPANRMPLHMTKCQYKSKKVLETCPFNATHRVTRNQLPIHLSICPDSTNLINPQRNELISFPKIPQWVLRVKEEKVNTNDGEDNEEGQKKMTDARESWDS